MAKSDANVAPYQINEDRKSFLGIPNHKVGFMSNIILTEYFSINPSLVYLSQKYAVSGVANANDEYPVSVLDAKYLVNFNLRYRDLFFEGFEANLGIYDIFNQKVNYVQPYKGGLTPLPGTGTEVVLRLAYALAFHK